MLVRHGCPKCGAALQERDQDRYGSFERCLTCGMYRDIGQVPDMAERQRRIAASAQEDGAFETVRIHGQPWKDYRGLGGRD